MKKSTRVLVLVLVSTIATQFQMGDAYSLPSKSFGNSAGGRFSNLNDKRRNDSSSTSIYLQPTSPISQTNTRLDINTSFKKSNTVNEASKSWHYRMSDSSLNGAASAVSSSDVLPQFRAAHGLLHPHTVMRLEEASYSSKIRNSAAIDRFLDTYKEQGPMACIPFLSDPNVLPELTNAMRGISA